MTSDYFLKRGEQVCGPLSAVSLRTMASRGELGPDDLIGRGGDQPWVPAGRIRGLFEAPASTSHGVAAEPQATADPSPDTADAASRRELERDRTGPEPPEPRMPAMADSHPARSSDDLNARFVQLAADPSSGSLFALDVEGKLWALEHSIELPERRRSRVWVLQPVARCVWASNGGLEMAGSDGSLSRVSMSFAASPSSRPSPREPPDSPAPARPEVPTASTCDPQPERRRADDDAPRPNPRGYVGSHLNAGEQVLLMTRLHWSIFFTPRSLLTLGILPLIDRATSEFAVTNKRVIIKVGWIYRRTVEMNLAKIESVNVDQSLLGRLLGFGTIEVIGTGGTREPFPRIADPMRFKRTFQEAAG